MVLIERQGLAQNSKALQLLLLKPTNRFPPYSTEKMQYQKKKKEKKAVSKAGDC